MAWMNLHLRTLFELETSQRVPIPVNYKIEKEICEVFHNGNKEARKELHDYRLTLFKQSSKIKRTRLRIFLFLIISLVVLIAAPIVHFGSEETAESPDRYILVFLLSLTSFAWNLHSYRKRFVGKDLEGNNRQKFKFKENEHLAQYFQTLRDNDEPIYASSDMNGFGHKIKSNLVKAPFAFLALIGNNKQRYGIHHLLLFADGNWWFPFSKSHEEKQFSTKEIKKKLDSENIQVQNFADLKILLGTELEFLFDEIEHILINSGENMLSDTKKSMIQKSLDALRYAHLEKVKYVDEGTSLTFEVDGRSYIVSASWFNKLIRGGHPSLTRYIFWLKS